MNKKTDRDTLMLRARAAKTIINSRQSQKDADRMEMAAFMALFHPNYPEEKLRSLLIAQATGNE